MTDEAKRLATLAKLVGIAQELHDKLAAVYAEMDALCAGKASLAQNLKVLEAAWQAAWSSRYLGQYVFTYLKDRPQWKRLLRTFTPEELQLRMMVYIRNDDAFYVQRRHPLSVFVASINAHAVPSSDLEFSPPTDCRHTPPCLSDSQHTSRRSAESRVSE